MRALQPLRRAARGQALQPVQLGRALDEVAHRFADHRANPWCRCRRLVPVGPVADRGLLRLQQAHQGLAGHQQRRHQLAPVHEQRGGRLQASLGMPTRPRPATTTSHWRRPSSSPAPTWPGRTRCCTAGWKTRAAPTRRRSDRGRPAPHRNRRRCRPAPAAAARYRRGAAPRTAARDAVGRPDRHGLHRRAHHRLCRAARPRARVHAGPRGQGPAGCRPTTSCRPRAGLRVRWTTARAPSCRCGARA
jgi:hypothetical protein